MPLRAILQLICIFSGLLKILCGVLVSSGIPAEILTEVISILNFLHVA